MVYAPAAHLVLSRCVYRENKFAALPLAASSTQLHNAGDCGGGDDDAEQVLAVEKEANEMEEVEMQRAAAVAVAALQQRLWREMQAPTQLRAQSVFVRRLQGAQLGTAAAAGGGAAATDAATDDTCDGDDVGLGLHMRKAFEAISERRQQQQQQQRAEGAEQVVAAGTAGITTSNDGNGGSRGAAAAVVQVGSCTAVNFHPGWCNSPPLSVLELLQALGDAPQAYRVCGNKGQQQQQGSRGGLSKRQVCWFGPVPYTYGGQTFPPCWPLPHPKLRELLAAVSAGISLRLYLCPSLSSNSIEVLARRLSVAD